MIDKLKYYYISQVYKKKQEIKNFNGLLNKVKNVFIIMPENENHFTDSVPIAEYLSTMKKEVTLFINNSVLHLFYNSYNFKIEEYFETDKNRFGFPTRSIKAKLKKIHCDLLIDLNKEENLFLSVCGKNICTAASIGFTNTLSDFSYDIQFSPTEDNSKISYKNFLNCLQMFL